MADCEHWLPIMLEQEKADRIRIERENQVLLHKLAEIADIAKVAFKDESNRLRAIQPQEILWRKMISDRRLEARSALGGMLGGLCPPWF